MHTLCNRHLHIMHLRRVGCLHGIGWLRRAGCLHGVGGLCRVGCLHGVGALHGVHGRDSRLLIDKRLQWLRLHHLHGLHVPHLHVRVAKGRSWRRLHVPHLHAPCCHWMHVGHLSVGACCTAYLPSMHDLARHHDSLVRMDVWMRGRSSAGTLLLVRLHRALLLPWSWLARRGLCRSACNAPLKKDQAKRTSSACNSLLALA